MAQEPQTQLAQRAQPYHGERNGELSLQLTTMSEVADFASQMAKANLLPAHLQNKPADCLRVVLQAAQWRMNPFAVADKTSVISGKLMYEGQLVAAVVNARGNLASRLRYDFTGSGISRELKVVGTIQGEKEPRDITLTYAQAVKINRNGNVAQGNTDQQMVYIGVRIWARRHMPELLLGVYTPDEMDDAPATIAEDGHGEPITARPIGRRRGLRAAAEVVTDATAEPLQQSASPSPAAESAEADQTQQSSDDATEPRTSNPDSHNDESKSESVSHAQGAGPRVAVSAEREIGQWGRLAEDGKTVVTGPITTPRTTIEIKEVLEGELRIVGDVTVRDIPNAKPGFDKALEMTTDGVFAGTAFSFLIKDANIKKGATLRVKMIGRKGSTVPRPFITEVTPIAAEEPESVF